MSSSVPSSASESQQIESQLGAVQQQAEGDITAAASLDDLDQVRVKYLGKKGALSKVLGGMGKLSAEERPKIGKLANEAKTALQSQIEARKETLQAEKIKAQLASETLDVTSPGGDRSNVRVQSINSIIQQIPVNSVGLG